MWCIKGKQMNELKKQPMEILWKVSYMKEEEKSNHRCFFLGLLTERNLWENFDQHVATALSSNISIKHNTVKQLDSVGALTVTSVVRTHNQTDEQQQWL